jgi:hypothetical protein
MTSQMEQGEKGRIAPLLTLSAKFTQNLEA